MASEGYRVLVAGAGAIGAMVAWQVFRKDPGAVSVLARGERLERYRRDGFVANGEHCRFPVTDAASISEPDLVVVACKWHHLGEVIEDLRGHVGPRTRILSLLNGISSEDELARAFGAERVPYAMIVGTDAGHRGNEITWSGRGTIYLGGGPGIDGGPPARGAERACVADVCRVLDHYGIANTVPDDMLNRLWYKFMMNVGLNQVTAVLRLPYAPVQTPTLVPELRELMASAMREVISVGEREGISLGERDIESVWKVLDGLSPEGKTSMCQDVEAGRKTEVEMFALKVMELGERHGVDVPVNACLYRMIRTIEKTTL